MHRHLCIILLTCFWYITELQAQEMDSFYSKLDFRSPKENALLSGSSRGTPHIVKSSDDFNFQISFGPGIIFYNEFIQQFGVFTIDAGFKSNNEYIFITGLDIIYDFNYKENSDYSQIAANLFCSPSLLFQTSIFKFYLGIGASINIPNVFTSSIFALARFGIKPNNYSSIDLSTRLPYYIRSVNISPPMITLNYALQF